MGAVGLSDRAQQTSFGGWVGACWIDADHVAPDDERSLSASGSWVANL